MTLKQIKKHIVFKILTNKYVLILIIFFVWMFFFDENYYLNKEFDKEIKDLENINAFYTNKTQKNNKEINSLKDSSQLEKFAREQYLLKRKNEDVYIIEPDTIKK
ncbi:septum formation initiator family protein [Flavobacteriaceae bacterium S356]|uniref:Septum formation initiator family protein n=1 Tax=Asprobacillus argus TaxID=3076534 RepID=A0ABU3LI69_9FLAO|nr:septum formation initiator family protein [Flavobacteriaceae bacterium S356]